MADSTLTIYGNLTRDPELRFTAGGKAVASLAVAVNHRFKQNNEWVDGQTEFYDCTVWEQLAENAAASLVKGQRVMVTGRLETRKWEDKEGKERTTLQLVVDEIGASLKFGSVGPMQRTPRQASEPEHRSSKQANAQPATEYEYTNEEPFVSLYRGHQSYRNLAVSEPWM